MELGKTSKHESLKSRICKYLNLERHITIRDSVVGPTPLIGEKMVRNALSFVNILKHFHPTKYCPNRTNAKSF